jgi:ABC-type dipeptide/oligopeptide/nickel transport system permease subunit
MLAVQNAVPYAVLGAATSTTAFFRSIGGSVGLAVFGSVMNNRFAAEIMTKLPTDFTKLLPPQQLDTLTHNPQALMNPEAQNQLQGIIGNLGDKGAALLQQVMHALRESLSLSISNVFLYSFMAIIVAFIINFFIKEIPLRRHHHMDTSHLEKKVE